MRVLAGGAVTIAVLVAAGCGGGGGSDQLSANAYRTQLKTIAKESDAAQHAVEHGFQATSVPQLVKVLVTFSAAEKRIGDQVAALKPPTNAESANTELATGQKDAASEVHAALRKVKEMQSTKAAIAYLSKASTTKGGREIDQALAKLKQLGYITNVS